LLTGNLQPLTALVLSYQKLFLPFARRRLFHPQEAEDVLQNFWAELMNGKAICRYARQPEPQASLRSFCLGILHRRIIDRNRQISRERQRFTTENPIADNSAASPEELLTQSVSDDLARRLMHAALIKLADHSPQDADLLRWHLEGLTYEAMAKRLLGPGQTAAAPLKKKINALKKQFTRESSGSLARFRAILQELMQAQGLSFADFWR
jgi:RNA polymerase sigma factor (sigma-70 family)